MPKTAGGLFSWLIGTVLVVGIGIAILSRIPSIWSVVNKGGVSNG